MILQWIASAGITPSIQWSFTMIEQEIALFATPSPFVLYDRTMVGSYPHSVYSDIV